MSLAGAGGAMLGVGATDAADRVNVVAGEADLAPCTAAGAGVGRVAGAAVLGAPCCAAGGRVGEMPGAGAALAACGADGADVACGGVAVCLTGAVPTGGLLACGVLAAEVGALAPGWFAGPANTDVRAGGAACRAPVVALETGVTGGGGDGGGASSAEELKLLAPLPRWPLGETGEPGADACGAEVAALVGPLLSLFDVPYGFEVWGRFVAAAIDAPLSAPDATARPNCGPALAAPTAACTPKAMGAAEPAAALLAALAPAPTVLPPAAASDAPVAPVVAVAAAGVAVPAAPPPALGIGPVAGAVAAPAPPPPLVPVSVSPPRICAGFARGAATGRGRLRACLASCSADMRWYMSAPINAVNL
jgi:hypothetical protein